MQTIQNQTTSYKEITLAANQTGKAQAAWRSFFSQVRQSWRRLLDKVVPNQEIKIWTYQDSNQETSWYAYDPQTNRIQEFSSQYEISAWLEEYYGIE